MDIKNNAEFFGTALDEYEKAVARADYGAALAAMEQAIQYNPFPSLYAHLGKCRLSAADAKAHDDARKRNWWKRLMPAPVRG